MRSFGGPLISLDEVGRGAIAGPVAVGAVWVDEATLPLEGVRDSKLLSPARRESLAGALREQLVCAVGSAEAREVDEHGIVTALRLAGMRALEQLPEPAGILLDGSHDWLSSPHQGDLLSAAVEGPGAVVKTLVKADMACWGVAAASILAKVWRDEKMRQLAVQDPRYGFEQHKGYGTAAHSQAIRAHGLTPAHRRSWAITPSPDPQESR